MNKFTIKILKNFIILIITTILLIFIYFLYYLLKTNEKKENPIDFSTLPENDPGSVEGTLNKNEEKMDSQKSIVFNRKNINKPTSVKVKTLHQLKDGTIIEKGDETIISIPPNNSVLNFTLIISEIFSLIDRSGKINIEERFSWKEKNPNISKVFNQYNCGCCWAVGVSQSMNDSFMISKNVKNPNFSPQILLSCYPDSGQCKGDNPVSILKWIEKNGLEKKKLNYDWCTEDKECTTKFSKSNPSPDDLMLVLSNKIEECPKKEDSKEDELEFRKHYVTKIIHPHLKITDKDLKSKLKVTRKNIKVHIKKHGPVVGGFLVLKNLFHGNFLSSGNKHAIYFDKFDYKKKIREDKLDPSKIVGFHVISVVGWGVDKEVDGIYIGKTPGTKHKVEYWIVRNSWGEKWGIDGYFHLAMYPHNKHSTLDISIKMEEGYRGGIITFVPSYNQSSLKK